MLKVLLCFSMLITMLDSKTTSSVQKIEYTAKDYQNKMLNLKININVSKRDIITLNVYFYHAGIKQEKYYNSSLTIEKSSETIAKIPIEIINEMEMNVVVVSHNLNKEISNVFLPLYPYNQEICTLKENDICTSNYPSIVSYENNKLKEKHEIISFVNKELFFYSTNNLLPLDRILLITNLDFNIEGYGIIYIDKCEIPIKVTGNGVKKLALENMYYLDIKNGKTYDNYVNNTIYDNQIIFPYESKTYRVEVVLHDCFIAFDKLSFSFAFNTQSVFMGDCNNGLYCLRRIYL